MLGLLTTDATPETRHDPARRAAGMRPAPTRRALTRAALAAVVVALALCSSCAVVKPWQRGRLSHPAMRLEGAVGDSFRPHLMSIREGAVGGEGSAGGGCGCN